jgi:acyl carrier protein
MTKDEFLRALEETLELNAGTLERTKKLEDLEDWDSMSALTYMALADEKLQVNVSGDQIVRCKTVDDLLGLLGDKLTG